MLIVLLLLLAAVAAAALALLWLVVRGHNKRLLLAGSHAVASDTPDGIGISVLCSGVRAQEQVENLLSAEYAHYEVIVVLDSLRYPVEFAAFTARYRMIRVEYVLSEELPVTGVRALGRSRKRRFRRLVLVDRAQDTPAGDFDAAAEVAAYDYVLPVREGQFLLPDAVARLVAEVGERGVGGCDCVRSRIGEPAALLSREAVIAAGGFAHRPGKSVPRRRRRNLCEAGFLCAAVWAQAVSRAAVRAARRGGCVVGRRNRRRRMDGPVAGGRRTAHRSPRVVRRRMCFAGPQRYCLRAYGRRRKGAAAPL